MSNSPNFLKGLGFDDPDDSKTTSRSSLISLSDEVVVSHSNNNSNNLDHKNTSAIGHNRNRDQSTAATISHIQAMHPTFSSLSVPAPPPGYGFAQPESSYSSSPSSSTSSPQSQYPKTKESIFSSTTSVHTDQHTPLPPNLNLSITIPHSFTNSETSDKFTFYEVEIKFNNPTNPTHSKTFSVKKRFKEFDTLHTDLVNSLKANTKKSKDLYTLLLLPKLPSKTLIGIFGMSSSSTVVEGRKVLLQTYLNELIDSPTLFDLTATEATAPVTTPLVLAFLDSGDGQLGVQLNCVLLENRVSRLALLCKDLTQAATLSDQMVAGQGRMIEMLQSRIEALEVKFKTQQSQTQSAFRSSAFLNPNPNPNPTPAQRTLSLQLPPPPPSMILNPLPTFLEVPYTPPSAPAPTPAQAESESEFSMSAHSPTPFFLTTHDGAIGGRRSLSEAPKQVSSPILSSHFLMQPVTPPSPSQCAKHNRSKSRDNNTNTNTNTNNNNSRSNSTSSLNLHRQPSNPWQTESSTALAFVSSPPQTNGDSNGCLNEILPLNLVPTNVKPTQLDIRVSELLAILRPTVAATLHRHSIIKYTAQHVKQTLGAQCFPVGAFALKTYLPDEWLRMSAFLCQGQEQLWFMKVNEVLCKASNSEEEEEGKEEGKEENNNKRRPKEEGGHEHVLSNVNFVNTGETRAIRCTVDSVTVDMTANNIEELYQTTFLEECDLVLGKNHLLKNSLILLKAWWLYESRVVTGSTILQTIPDFALSVMMLHIINKHHRQVHHPLQILAIFFNVYSKLDWAYEGVSMEEIVKVEGEQIHRSEVDADADDDSTPTCFKISLLNKYRQRYNQSRISGRTSSTTRTFSTSNIASTHASAVLDKEAANLNSRKCTLDSKLRASMFVVGAMNIVNPLDAGENLMENKISERKALRITQILQIGAKNLQPILSHLDKETKKSSSDNSSSFVTSVALFDNFFSNSWSRLGTGWRPDISELGTDNRNDDENKNNNDETKISINSSNVIRKNDSESSRDSNAHIIKNGDCLDADFDKLWENLDFCAFLLEKEITHSALKTLATIVLSEKGPMPVGEIGKMLQENTANPTLSNVLKEQFGGLKKFLEQFPDTFLISVDHPFNPYVYLKDQVTDFDASQILAGTFKRSGTTNSARKRVKRKKKKIDGGEGGGGGGRELSDQAASFTPGSLQTKNVN